MPNPESPWNKAASSADRPSYPSECRQTQEHRSSASVAKYRTEDMRCPAHPAEAVAGSEKAAVSAATAHYWVASSSFVGPDRKAVREGSCDASPDKAGVGAGDGEVWANPVEIVTEEQTERSKKGVESAIAPQVARKLAFSQCNLQRTGEDELDSVGLCVP